MRTVDLTSAARAGLLAVARASALRALGVTAVRTEPGPTVAGLFGGAFVTLWHGERLRGCMGSFAPTTDLPARVAEVARSVLTDPRFVSDPVTATEFDVLSIEVSVLSELARTSDPLSLVPGVHGVLIRQAGRSGCFLPKVAVDRGWSAVEFLRQCCTIKAGLPADAWRDPSCLVSLFTVDSFREGT